MDMTNIIQIGLLLVGAAIIVSIFWDKIGKKEESVDDTVVPLPKPEPDGPEDPVVVPVDDSHDFMCLVQKWDALRTCCHEQGLHDTCKILDEQVFPTLNNHRKLVDSEAAK